MVWENLKRYILHYDRRFELVLWLEFVLNYLQISADRVFCSVQLAYEVQCGDQKDEKRYKSHYPRTFRPVCGNDGSNLIDLFACSYPALVKSLHFVYLSVQLAYEGLSCDQKINFLQVTKDT